MNIKERFRTKGCLKKFFRNILLAMLGIIFTRNICRNVKILLLNVFYNPFGNRQFCFVYIHRKRRNNDIYISNTKPSNQRTKFPYFYKLWKKFLSTATADMREKGRTICIQAKLKNFSLSTKMKIEEFLFRSLYHISLKLTYLFFFFSIGY